MFSRCNHNWEILKDTVYPSNLEEYKKITDMDLKPRYINSVTELTQHEVILVIACKKCGKLKIKRYTV